MSKKRGSNFIPLVLDTRLLMAINGKASEKKQLNATYIMSTLVEHCKSDLTKEAYEELKARYSLTVYEQKKAKMSKEKAKLEHEKKKLALKERELQLKEQNAKIFEEQTNISVRKENKPKIRKLQREKTELENALETNKPFLKSKPKEVRAIAKKQDREMKTKLKEVNEQLEKLDTDKSKQYLKPKKR